jgi:hypothetical protein
MTLAQKKARANFKKAIAYRKKTGCSLKQAFAHVKKGGKVGATKVVEKGEKKTAKVTKVLQRVRTKKGTFKGYKRVAGSSHKDTKSHNVNIRVVSGIKPKQKIVLLAKNIQKLTDINDHTGAVLKLAKFLKDPYYISVLNGIEKVHNKLGYLPAEYSSARNFTLNQLLNIAKDKLPGVEYQLINKSF